MTIKQLIAAAAVVSLAACGGGTGSMPHAAPTGAQDRPKGEVAFTITIPKFTPSQAALRRPMYVSPNTQSVVIQQLDNTSGHNPVGSALTVDVTSTSNGCTTNSNGTTCTTTFSAAAGTFDFSIKTYSAAGGGGNLLSENTLSSFTVIAGQSNTLSVTLNGVLASLTHAASISGTLTAAQTLTFAPQDPSGATIIGSGVYDNGPLTVAGTGVTITPASFNGPGDGTSLSLQCGAVGTYTISFTDASGSLGTTTYTCSGQAISIAPGTLSFDTVAASGTDSTYDQNVTATDPGGPPGTTLSIQWHISCAPGPGEASGTQVATVASPTSATTAIRPLNPGTCNVYATDNVGQQSQTISVEVHTTSIGIH